MNCRSVCLMFDDRYDNSLPCYCELADGHLGQHVHTLRACEPVAKLVWNDPRFPTNGPERFMYSFALGLMQSSAIFGLIGFVVLAVLGQWLAGVPFALISALGWLGWGVSYRFAISASRSWRQRYPSPVGNASASAGREGDNDL